jgi:effector-binding domain-containing protein
MAGSLSEHRIVESSPQPTIAVRVRVPMDDLDLAALFATHLQRVHALVGERAGPAYGRYHEFGPTHVDVEMGIVVGDSTPPAIPDEEGEDRIQVSELPGGPIAMAVHRGSYDGLGDAYNELHDWIHQQGREDGPGPWESYIDDPGAVEDIADLRTELHWPLVES